VSRKPPIHQERGKVSFALFLYPFEATHIDPGTGGENVERVRVDGHGVEIAQREYPDDWQMVRDDCLWWISLDRPWLKKVDIRIPANTTQFELEFLVTAINISIDPMVFFTRFARRDYNGIIEDGETSRPSGGSEFVNALQRQIPDRVVIDGNELTTLVTELFENVILEEHSDVSKAVESYRAALQSFHSEVHVRLFYSVCENALFTGNPGASEKDRIIANISSLDIDEAEAWRHLVNRTKHPDEGTSHDWDDTFEDVPPPIEFRMREAANEALRSQILKP
jgi:hypothetical protein